MHPATGGERLMPRRRRPRQKGERAPTDTCNAKLRPSAKHNFCPRGAGEGTDHPGQGRCWQHGGKTPIKTGLHSIYARTRLGPLIERVEAAEPTRDGLRGEAALVRAGLLHLIENAAEGLVPVAMLADLASKLSQIEERDHRIRTSKAITLETLAHVVQQSYIITGQEIERVRAALSKIVPAALRPAVEELFSGLLAAIERRAGELQIPGKEANR